MKLIAVNGSPRKNCNTKTLLQNVLQGAETKGAETKLVHLYDLNFKGCVSCFACKRKGSSCAGLCIIKDELTQVLGEILECDTLVLGSPIYFGSVTGEMQSFMERLLFPNLSYNANQRSVFKGKITSAFIYTMNVAEEQMKEMNYDAVFQKNKNILQILNGDSEILLSKDTYQFKDYALYEASKFDEAHKAQVKSKQFPLDCEEAFEMGARLASL